MSALGTDDLVRIEGKLDRVLSLLDGSGGPARRRGLTIKGVIDETGLRSEMAARRWLKLNRVRPYAPGKWHYDAVQSAMARRSFADLRSVARAKAGGAE